MIMRDDHTVLHGRVLGLTRGLRLVRERPSRCRVSATLLLLVLSACNMPSTGADANAELFQCLMATSPPPCGLVVDRDKGAKCRAAYAKADTSIERGCIGYRWSIPKRFNPIRLTEGNSNETLQFSRPLARADQSRNDPGQSSLFRNVRVEPVPFADLNLRMEAMMQAYRIGSAPIRSGPYWVRRSADIPGDRIRVLMTPTGMQDHYLLCSADTTKPTLQLIGACQVKLQFKDAIALSYYVPAQDIASVASRNNELRRLADSFVIQEPSR
jgi:hypothetical protein